MSLLEFTHSLTPTIFHLDKCRVIFLHVFAKQISYTEKQELLENLSLVLSSHFVSSEDSETESLYRNRGPKAPTTEATRFQFTYPCKTNVQLIVDAIHIYHQSLTY